MSKTKLIMVILDVDLTLKKVFKKIIPDLTTLLSTEHHRLAMAAELISKDLITDASYREAGEYNNKSGIERGSALVNAIKHTVDTCQPTLSMLNRLIVVFDKIDAFKPLAEQMKEDLK